MNNEEKIIGMLEQVMNKVTNLEQEVRLVRTTQENTVIPQIKLLAEGHAMLSEKIDRLSIVEAQEDDMATMKAAIKYLSIRVSELEKSR